MSKIKTCPECGSNFTCDGNNDCWCETVQINKREFMLLNEKYTDCICKKCLSQYEDK